VAHAEVERKKQSRKPDSLVTIEATQDAEDEWSKLCSELSAASLLSKGDEASWLFGTNVFGADPKVLFYLGGLKLYRKYLKDVKDEGFRGFRLSS
jgi:hypothetical protein